jgi:hypothetical protein
MARGISLTTIHLERHSGETRSESERSFDRCGHAERCNLLRPLLKWGIEIWFHRKAKQLRTTNPR